MNRNQQVGIVCLMASVGFAMWTYSRVTSFVGRLHSWTMPLDGFETATVGAGLVGLLLSTVGLRKLSAKEKSGSKDE